MVWMKRILPQVIEISRVKVETHVSIISLFEMILKRADRLGQKSTILQISWINFYWIAFKKKTR